MNIDFTRTIIEKAFQQAVFNAKQKSSEANITSDDLQKLHALRAREWVEALADNFREYYKKADNYRVFSKYYSGENEEQRKDFDLNELLFDISVVKINKTLSPRNIELPYIEKAEWIIESEMAKNTRELVYDFNKLIIGDAENKLFVGPISDEIEKFIPKLGEIARNCRGTVYLSLISHPEMWDKEHSRPKIWKFNGEEFINLELLKV